MLVLKISYWSLIPLATHVQKDAKRTKSVQLASGVVMNKNREKTEINGWQKKEFLNEDVALIFMFFY